LIKTTLELKYGSNSNPIFLIFIYFGIPILPKYLMKKEQNSISNLNNYIFIKHGKSLNIKGYRLFDLTTIKYLSIGKSLLKKMPFFWVPRPTHQKLNLSL
jgi:hypothetical protein